MTLLSAPPITSFSGGPPRPAPAVPVVAVPTQPVAPAVARVEWQGAVRPVDAVQRPARADPRSRPEAEWPTGPPPAFAANMLDQLPDSLDRLREQLVELPEADAAAAPVAQPEAPPANAPPTEVPPTEAPPAEARQTETPAAAPGDTRAVAPPVDGSEAERGAARPPDPGYEPAPALFPALPERRSVDRFV
jgi:nicotinate-nucleotide--dimethylbenzimidazole phosphoribosyltransferase